MLSKTLLKFTDIVHQQKPCLHFLNSYFTLHGLESKDPSNQNLMSMHLCWDKRNCPTPKILNTGPINNHSFHFLSKSSKIFYYFSIRKSSISDNKRGFCNKLAKLECFLLKVRLLKCRFVLDCGPHLTLASGEWTRRQKTCSVFLLLWCAYSSRSAPPPARPHPEPRGTGEAEKQNLSQSLDLKTEAIIFSIFSFSCFIFCDKL